MDDYPVQPTVEFKPFVPADTCTTFDVYCDGKCYGFVYRDPSAGDGVRMRWEPHFAQPSEAQRKAIRLAVAHRYPDDAIHEGEAKWPATQYHPDLPHTHGAKPD